MWPGLLGKQSLKMEGIFNLLKPVVESKTKKETLPRFLTACADQRAFSKGAAGIPVFVGLINARLNEPASRLEGLQLLQVFLPQCSVDTLTRNGSLWMQLCLKGIPVTPTCQLSFVVLKTLIELSTKVPELSKHVSSNVIPNFIEHFHKGIDPQSYLHALECLEQCMTSFSGPCGPQRKVIERFLLSIVDYSGPLRLNVVWQAACCFAQLPQIGGGGIGGAMHKCAWSAQQQSLCRTIHLLLDDLYSNINELQVMSVGGTLEGVEPIPLNPIDDIEPVLRAQKLGLRFYAVTAFHQAMLLRAFPVAKSVYIPAIFNVICRGLAVNGGSLGNTTTVHSLALFSELPKLHYHLLKLLESLIITARNNLLPYAGLMCRLAIQTLKWTRVDSWPYGSEKPYSLLRTQAYRILTLWCGSAKMGSLVEDVADQLVELSLNDIRSEKDSVLLSGTLSKKNKYAKAKMNSSQDATNQSSATQSSLLSIASANETANESVCTAALKCLEAMISSASFKIQVAHHKVLQETVVTILLQLTCQSGKPIIPYSATAPRLGLYSLLLQLVLNCHPVWPAPTNIALKLFAKGLNDSSSQVSVFCGMAQSAIVKIIHPAYAPLLCKPRSEDTENRPGVALVAQELSISYNASYGQHDEVCGTGLSDALNLLREGKGDRQSVLDKSSTPQEESDQSASKRKVGSVTLGDEVIDSPAIIAFRKSSVGKSIELPSSTPQDKVNKKNLPDKEVNSVAGKLKDLDVSYKSDSGVLNDKEVNSVAGKLKNLDVCSKSDSGVLNYQPKNVPDSSSKKNKSDSDIKEVVEDVVQVLRSPTNSSKIGVECEPANVREFVDITLSDKSDDEEEISEIDLASEDDISICSRSTINSENTNKTILASIEKTGKETASQRSPVLVSTAEQSEVNVKANGLSPTSSSPVKVAQDSQPQNEEVFELLIEKSQVQVKKSESPTEKSQAQGKKSESPVPKLPETPPRVLRSRTISNSSSASNTPTKRTRRRAAVIIDTTLVEEEVTTSSRSGNVAPAEGDSETKMCDSNASNDAEFTSKPVTSDSFKSKPCKITPAGILELNKIRKSLEVEVPDQGEKRASDLDVEPEAKKQKVDETDYLYEDDIDEEAMLSSFIDVTQGDEGF